VDSFVIYAAITETVVKQIVLYNILKCVGLLF